MGSSLTRSHLTTGAGLGSCSEVVRLRVGAMADPSLAQGHDPEAVSDSEPLQQWAEVITGVGEVYYWETGSGRTT